MDPTDNPIYRTQNCPMCRESINGDNIFVASVFEPEKTVKDEEFKEEQAEMLEVSSGLAVYSKTAPDRNQNVP